MRTSAGFEAVTPRQRYDALTNWAMKPLALGPGHLWVVRKPLRNNCEVIIWNISNIELRVWNQGSCDPRSCESNLCNWVYRSLQKVRTLMGFEPLTLWQRCDALTNWAMKLLTSGAGHLWFLRSLGGIHFEVIYAIFHILNSWCEIK